MREVVAVQKEPQANLVHPIRFGERQALAHEARKPLPQVREEADGVAQEGAFTLHTPKLLDQSEGENLRVREALERLVAPGAGIEVRVSVVDKAEEHDDRLFHGGEAWGILGLGHPLLL